MTGISVIVPAFNAAATIAETLAGVTTQALPPDEVILVDDGSTDDTAARARAALPGLRLLRQANAGAAAATNAGLRAARFPLLALLDADDIWLPGKLAAQHARLQAEPALSGIGGHVEAFACPSLAPDRAARFRIPEAPTPALFGSALMLRRAAFDQVGFYDEALPVGFAIDWMHRARLAGLRFATLEDIVVRRRIREGSLSARSAARDRGYLEMARRAIRRGRGS